MNKLARSAWCALSGASVLAACAPTPSAAVEGPLPVPFAVSDYFAPTGYEGDGANVEDVNLVQMVNDACPSRAPEPIGDCYSITYDDGAVQATQGFAAVLWQYPNNNFGAYPGISVAPGATKVTVWARGDSGGEKIELQVGGISDPTLPYRDTVNVQTGTMTLTTDWQQLTIGLPGSYGAVLGGFGWIVKAPAPGTAGASPAPIVFYLDGIQWSP